jgi:hypothetical protein
MFHNLYVSIRKIPRSVNTNFTQILDLAIKLSIPQADVWIQLNTFIVMSTETSGMVQGRSKTRCSI